MSAPAVKSAYLDWLAGAMLGGREKNAPSAATGDLILGYATGYDAADVAPFVRSLRAVFNGPVVLVVDQNPELLAFLAENRIEAVPPEAAGVWSPHAVVARFAAFDRLLGNEDGNGHEAARFIGGLKRRPRRLHVVRGPARPHEGIDRPLHRLGRQDRVALHLKGANLEARIVLRRRRRGVNSQNSGQRQGARRASQRAMSLVIQHQSPVTRRPPRRPTPRTWSSGERHVRPTQAQRFSVKISRRFPVAYVLFRQATRTTSPGSRVARTP